MERQLVIREEGEQYLPLQRRHKSLSGWQRCSGLVIRSPLANSVWKLQRFVRLEKIHLQTVSQGMAGYVGGRKDIPSSACVLHKDWRLAKRVVSAQTTSNCSIRTSCICIRPTSTHQICIWNCNESGTQARRNGGALVLARTWSQSVHRVMPDQREWLSILVCVNAAGKFNTHLTSSSGHLIS
jgi:hypothetical protein